MPRKWRMMPSVRRQKRAALRQSRHWVTVETRCVLQAVLNNEGFEAGGCIFF